MIRTVVVDDQALVRTGIRVLPQTAPDIDAVGEAADGAEAVRLAKRVRPDVILMDIGCLEWTAWRRPAGYWRRSRARRSSC
jgi:DNA-binding NarL/FixJ family response regulator